MEKAQEKGLGGLKVKRKEEVWEIVNNLNEIRRRT